MHSTKSDTHPRSRTLIHPGPFNPVRIQTRQTRTARHVRLGLEPGASLFDGLVRPLSALGIRSASMTILGGAFDELQFCVAPPDPSGRAVIAYTRPTSAGPSQMVFGNATLGKGTDGRALVHCHAVIRTAAGLVKGGHIIAQHSIVGPRPITVLVTSLDGFELRVAFDPETNIPLMQPLEA